MPVPVVSTRPPSANGSIGVNVTLFVGTGKGL